MKKESIVVQRLKNYGVVVKRGYKHALSDLDGSLASATSLAIANGQVDAYNDMVKILKGGSAFKFDTKPESYYVSGFKVEDLEYVDKDSPLN
jgi:hypothetical protein